MKMVVYLSVILMSLPTLALSEETYKFERMWPTLKQPWYFYRPLSVAVDQSGYVYIAERDGNRIVKVDSNGYLVTQWGSSGTDKGQFSFPEGIAVDAAGNIYVSDSWNHRIQKFTPYGGFISMMGSYGSGSGQFDGPGGIAFDSKGNMYVTDRNNHRIQKFDSTGQFVTEWGSEGSGNGQFLNPMFIAIDSNDNVYVGEKDSYPNYHVQKFTSNGQFVTKWGPEDSVYDQYKDFDWHTGIAIDGNDNVFVAWRPTIDKFTADGQFVSNWSYCPDNGGNIAYFNGSLFAAGYEGVAKYSSDGQFLEWWSSSGGCDGETHKPERPLGVTRSSEGDIYVAEFTQVARFTSDGDLIGKWSVHLEDTDITYPKDVAVNTNGEIYVSITEFYGDHHIQKWSANGEFIGRFGKGGSGEGEFNEPAGIALDKSGNVCVVDSGNHRIQKFDSQGSYLKQWGTQGDGNGQFNFHYPPSGIAIDSNGNVYVADTGNHRVQKFTANGEFITKWGGYGTEDGNFFGPSGIETDDNGNVYVIDSWNYRIQKFTSEGSFITKYGSWGTNPGQMRDPVGITVDPGSEKIYVADYGNNRVQVFQKTLVSSNTKAIMVAGGGPYAGNNLWDAIQMCANFAYRTLTYQGFTKESIYYLSSNTALDLDNNGVADDVDGDATNSNLQGAITTWAKDADSLVIYLIDHGGNNTFRMSGTETLSASDLDTWLDTLQATMPGRVIVVYDACESGTFLPALTPPSGKERIVITSTSPDEAAKFVTQGSISFSNYFWTHIFNGVNVKDAFDLTREALTYSFSDQSPLLDANGNGMGNEAADFSLIAGLYIGSGTEIQGDAPVIGSVSPAQTITGVASALLYASNVTDSDDIARVWAVIRPPDYGQGGSDNPVTALPSVDLMPVGGDGYEGVYDSFNIEGSYQIAIYARDRIGNTSIPKLTTVSVQTPLRRKAVIVVGCSQTDALWPVVKENASLAYEALTYQGYKDDDIYFMSPVTFSAGVDVLPTLSNINYAINTWCKESTQDVVLYLVGNGDNGTFQINETETLSATDLDSWLDTLQGTLPGKVAVIYDACLSGSFLPLLAPPVNKERIVISSASFSEPAHFVSQGNICFSKYFWSRVSNGANVRDSFLHGKKAIVFSGDGQVPQLDDTGNGIGNEKADGRLARNYTIGVGIMLAGDDPIIGSVSPAQTLSEETSATIWAKDVTSTGAIGKVWAVITPPNYLSGSNSPVTDLPTLDLTSLGNNRYEGTYADFTLSGTYNIAVFAMDTKGVLSLPVQTTVTVTNGCLSVAGDLSIWVPCAEYNGTQYGFTLSFYSNPDDASGFHWKLDMATLTGGTGTDCIPIGSDLSMPISCAAYNGAQYGFTLRFYNNPYDPSGLYWKMGMTTLEVK